jgi:hypothetical protein
MTEVSCRNIFQAIQSVLAALAVLSPRGGRARAWPAARDACLCGCASEAVTAASLPASSPLPHPIYPDS